MAEPRPNRLIVGNLDAEVELARSASGVVPGLRSAVVERISAAAASLSVFGEAGDSLWTPVPIDPARLGPGAPALVSGPLEALAAPDALIAWGETPRVRALRRTATTASASGTWRELLWRLTPSVASARRCNDRRFAHRLAVDLGVAPRGACLFEDIAGLERALAADDAPHTWVAKAPMSASGRDRVRRRGRDLPDDVRARVVRLLDRGPLLFEPWHDRMLDVAVVGVVTSDGVLRFPPHRLEVDHGGVFRGIVIDDPGDVGLLDHERQQLDQVVARVARALRDVDYVGPFGVDAYVHRTADGRRALRPLCEINARLTFGHVARAHAEVAALPHGIRFAMHPGPAPDGAHTIVRSGPPDHLAVWLTSATR